MLWVTYKGENAARLLDWGPVPGTGGMVAWPWPECPGNCLTRSTWGNCDAHTLMCHFFPAVPMEQFGGGGAFCHGGTKLSFPEGLRHGKTSSTRQTSSCLLVLSTTPAKAWWSHRASLFIYIAFQHLAMYILLREGHYTWASSAAGEGMHPASTCPKRWGKTGPGRGSPLKKGSCSLLLLDQDVPKSWGLSLAW